MEQRFHEDPQNMQMSSQNWNCQQLSNSVYDSIKKNTFPRTGLSLMANFSLVAALQNHLQLL